jgi:hypothetical protein
VKRGAPHRDDVIGVLSGRVSEVGCLLEGRVVGHGCLRLVRCHRRRLRQVPASRGARVRDEGDKFHNTLTGRGWCCLGVVGREVHELELPQLKSGADVEVMPAELVGRH